MDVMGLWDRLLGRSDSARARDSGSPHLAASRLLDEALTKAKIGAPVSEDELRAAASRFAAYYDFLAERHGTSSNLEFPEEDRCSFFVEALKLAALDHPDHSAWPFVSSIRGAALPALRRRLLNRDDPWLHLCVILPALLGDEVELAVESFQAIRGDLFFATLAVRWVEESILSFPRHNNIAAAHRFLASIVPRRQRAAGPSGLSLARRWALAAAVHPSPLRDPRASLADARGAAVSRLHLEGGWNIRTTLDARRALAWLLDEGHRAALARDLAAPASALPSVRARLLDEHRDALRAHHAAAWDYCRLIQVARCSFAAGFLDEDEAWSWILRAARRLRDTYRSWSEVGDDYTLGLLCFDPEAAERSGDADCVRWLQNAPESLWNTLPWDLALPAGPRAQGG